MSGLMSKGDAARYLSMSEKWIQRHRVELGGYYLGGRLRFRRQNIDRYLDQQALARTSRRSLEGVKTRGAPVP